MNQTEPAQFPFSGRKRKLHPPRPGASGTTNHLARIWTLKGHYAKQVWTGLRSGERVSDLLRRQFPFVLPDAAVPPRLSVEFTNICNLRCPYCTSPLKLRPQGMMSNETFSSLVKQIKEADIRCVALVGTGEPTLHPNFLQFIRELAGATRILTVTSNWQRVDKELVEGILMAPVTMLNISVDGSNNEQYERSRPGGNFETLLANLKLLMHLKRQLKSSTYVNVRLMLRPSDQRNERGLRDFWAGFGDKVTRQYITDWAGVDEDVYALDCSLNRFPRCTLPFKQLEVHWNGNVPLCSYSHIQTGTPDGLSLGNLNTVSLLELWRGAVIQQYRTAHRRRDGSTMPVCNGCPGC
jgi:MoaA/NifB/PqqE/SkfB family radical SAM enzyme